MSRVIPTCLERTVARIPPPADEDNVKGTLALADLERIAFANNPTLSVAAARFEAALGRQVQARLYPNPIVGYHATEIGNLGTAGQQGGFISQRFITAGKRRLDGAITGKQADAIGMQLRAQELRALTDVRVRFYVAGIAQQRVELTRELVEIGDNLTEATRKLLAGQATKNDLLQAEIRADEARILHDNARNEHAEAWRRLAAVIGVASMPMKRLEGPIPDKSPVYGWEDCYQMVMDDHPDLAAARARAEAANLAVRRAKRQPIPNVDVLLSVRHNNITGSDNSNVQIGIPLPVFDRNQGNVRAAEAEWVAAKDEVKHIELSLRDRLAVAYRRYANARQQADRYRERIVPRAKQSLELVTQGYDKGQSNYLTLLTAQQTYAQVSLSYLDSLRELQTAAAVIEGKLLTGSLSVSR